MLEAQVPDGYCRGAPIPWWSKMAFKLALSPLPVSYRLWSRAGVFRHSFHSADQDKLIGDPQRAVNRFKELRGRLPHTVLELGPGEMTTRAVVYAALGIKSIILADVGDFGPTDVAAYEAAAAMARGQGLDPPDLHGAADRDAVLARCGARYFVDGLAALQSIAAGSVDLVISEAVIEHIRLDQLAPTFQELRRVSSADGLGRHLVDLHDHLGGRLNNLRFSRSLWEADWMARSGFYTNRVGASRIVEMLERAGFDVGLVWRQVWRDAPIARAGLARDVADAWSDEDLRVCTIVVETSPRTAAREG